MTNSNAFVSLDTFFNSVQTGYITLSNEVSGSVTGDDISAVIGSDTTIGETATTETGTDAATADPNAAAQGSIWSTIISFLPFVLIIAAFWFFLIRPQRKQEKETQKMRNSIEIGDQVTTIGGITGLVRQIKDDDTYIIETGADKNRISIKKWAIQSKDTISDN